MGTSDHLKQLFADDQLSNFLIILEVCHLCHKRVGLKNNLKKVMDGEGLSKSSEVGTSGRSA